MKIPFLKPTFPPIYSYAADFYKIYQNGHFTNNGPYVRRFENELKQYLGCANTPVMVNNATTGLIVAFKSLGLPVGSKVIVPSFTFAATIQALLWCGLEPLYCDINLETYNISIGDIIVLLSQHEDVSAICAVNCFGNPAEIISLEALATHNGIKLIFDSAGAIGSYYRGTKIGCFGDAEVFSLHATKLLPVGEGGFVTFKDSDALAHSRKMIDFGFNGDRSAEILGFNGKMNEFSAAIGLKSLDKLDAAVKSRNVIVDNYKNFFDDIKEVSFQKVDQYSSYQILGIRCANAMVRSSLKAHLANNDILTREYFNPPCHKQPFLEREVNLDNTERLACRTLSLPIWDTMNSKHFRHIQAAVKSWRTP